jgi:uncharacterized repeat protein (TIGR01451 family)
MKTKAGLILLIALLVCGVAFAAEFINDGNPYDTPVGTVLRIEGPTSEVTFTNVNLTVETQSPPLINITVLRESGFNIVGAAASGDDWTIGQATHPGVPVTYEVGVTNEGNGSFTFVMTKSSLTYEGLASLWTANFIDGATVTSEIRKTLPDNQDIFFKFMIVPSALELQSPAFSVGYVTLSATIEEGYPVPGSYESGAYSVSYLGVNGLYYGYITSWEGIGSAEIEAPLMALSRASTIDAPTLYTGGRADAVPGAVITYTITYTNEGNGSAMQTILVDKVPNDSEGNHVNRTGAQTNVEITAPQGNADGWVAFYSTDPAPSFVYGVTAKWSMLGTLETGSESWPLTREATFVKWEKPEVLSTEDGMTLTWGVTIK